MTKWCHRCNRLDDLPTATARDAPPFPAWPAFTVTVDGAVIRRRDALSGEWQYGWRVRDAADHPRDGVVPADRPTGPA